jgi:hypothetical protein
LSANRTRRRLPVIAEKKQEETGLATESGAFRETNNSQNSLISAVNSERTARQRLSPWICINKTVMYRG